MEQYINKAALEVEIKTRIETYNKGYANGDDCRADALETFLHDIDTLEAKDPYEQCIQYSTVRDGIEAHAETYSFNIESELFNQLTKEQQALWRKEIEQACISGGEAGVELARDPRYKENLESKEINSTDAFIEKACEFLSKSSNYNEGFIYPSHSGVIDAFVNNFKNYMKGE